MKMHGHVTMITAPPVGEGVELRKPGPELKGQTACLALKH